MSKRLSLIVLALTTLTAPAWGEISYVGSSTIGEHIIPDAARTFTAKTGIQFGTVEVQGSGKGLDMVMRGEAALAGVSRALTPAEKRARIYYEIIGYDAVSVFVHPDNPVATLTRQQLKAVYTGRIRNWKEVGWRNAPIVLITQIWGAKRAQMVEFQDHVLDGEPYRTERTEVDKQSDQVTALLTERHGISALSFAFARPGIKAIAINGFAPEATHIRSGAYLLSRPLIMVAEPRPRLEVRQFLDFLLTAEGQSIVARRFVPVR